MQRDGQHAINLRQRTLDGGRGDGQPESPRRQQPEHQRERFVLREHQRWQLETGAEAITAVAPALADDGDAEFLEHGDVASHRSLAHLQSRGEVGPLQASMRLQQLQHRQEASRRVVHRDNPPNT